MRRPPRKKKLSELLVKRAPPAAAAYLIWDAQQYGLALRVQPSGSKSYVVIYRAHGRPRWLHIGNVRAIGLADARELAAEAMLSVVKGGDPAAERQALRHRGTFQELATRYVELYAKKHNKSWRQADALVLRHLLPHWGQLHAASIARSDVKTMMSRITAPVLANQVLAAASAIFAWGVKQEVVTVNPCTGVPVGSISRMCTSPRATGRCSMPLGTTKASPELRVTVRSRSSMSSAPFSTRKKSSVSSCLCQWNGPSSLATMMSLSL
jgi:hypothetical protein